MTAIFKPVKIQDNLEGWGPCDAPEQLKDLPYAPFSKSDRLGKISDWSGVTYPDKRFGYKFQPQWGTGLYQYPLDDDESTFHLVDTTKVQKPIYQKGRVRYNQTKLKKEREKRQQAQASMQVLSKTQKSRERDRQRQLRKWQKQFGKQQMEQMKKMTPIKHRNASVQVKDSWAVIEEMDFPRLSKLSLPKIPEPVDLKRAGTLEYYEKSFDRITTKNEKKLMRVHRVFHRISTTDDPVIRQLSKKTGNVFATDSILAVLMCACRSVYSWDIVVSKVGKVLFFDKRDESDFDLPSVSETATEPPQDEGMNSPKNLALEATYINHNFSQQVLKMGDESYDFEEPNPFTRPDEQVASVGYRYRKWDLGNGVELVSRCEHDCVALGANKEVQFVNVKALNEWDSKFSGGVDWRSKLDTQRGAILATELKNNSCKLAKWTIASDLAGSDLIKFGYVSRVHPKDSGKHVILGVQQFKPSDFAQQINLNMENCWGILRCIIDLCMKQKDGKYLLMKDPNKPIIRLYDIPNDSFESEDDGETSSDDGSDEGSDDDDIDDVAGDDNDDDAVANIDEDVESLVIADPTKP